MKWGKKKEIGKLKRKKEKGRRYFVLNLQFHL